MSPEGTIVPGELSHENFLTVQVIDGRTVPKIRTVKINFGVLTTWNIGLKHDLELEYL